jgi:hypothetical protein
VVIFLSFDSDLEFRNASAAKMFWATRDYKLRLCGRAADDAADDFAGCAGATSAAGPAGDACAAGAGATGAGAALVAAASTGSLHNPSAFAFSRSKIAPQDLHTATCGFTRSPQPGHSDVSCN